MGYFTLLTWHFPGFKGKTYSREQNPSWKAKSHSASQEIYFLLWNLKVRYCIHKSQDWILSYGRWNQSTSPTLFLEYLL